MNILSVIGSPRKGGNTDILVDKILEGADKSGNTSEKVNLYNMEILPCIDCRRCKKDDLICTIKDDMYEFYPKIDQADVLIFGTPNYWNGPSAKTKLLVDRLRPYVANKKLEGKKAVLAVPAAEGPEASMPIVDMFRLSMEYLNVEFIGHVLGTAGEKREILNDQEALKKAYEIGNSL